MSEKYPNADTSAERLAEITADLDIHLKIEAGEKLRYVITCIRDLLAMLAERKAMSEEHRGRASDREGRLNGRIVRLEQQLHDQRWRRLGEDKPAHKGDMVEFKFELPSIPKTTITFTGWWDGGFGFIEPRDHDFYQGDEQTWWRPIPPLPKE